MARQFVQVRLSSSNGGKLYTYLNDEEADVNPGDTIFVDLPSGQRRPLEAIQVSSTRPPEVPSYINLKPCFKGG